MFKWQDFQKTYGDEGEPGVNEVHLADRRAFIYRGPKGHLWAAVEIYSVLPHYGLVGLYTRPDKRRQGLCKQLLRELINVEYVDVHRQLYSEAGAAITKFLINEDWETSDSPWADSYRATLDRDPELRVGLPEQ